MAILQESQVREILKEPRNSDQISKAKRLEDRVKLHAEAIVDNEELHSRFESFRNWVAAILPSDKMEAFCTLWTSPVETNELTESIFKELSRVFNAENPYIKHNFKDSDTRTDFEMFLASIDDERFWRVDYWNEIQCDMNSIVVVDLPAAQTTPKPEPYYYLLDIAHCLDIDVNKKGHIEYILFWTSEKGIILFIDDANYVKFRIPVNEANQWDFEKAVLESVTPHNLGRVPAKPVYFNPINKKQLIVNHNPITKSLGALDWLLFFEVAKKFLETYAPFPIYATYAELNDTIMPGSNMGEEDLSVGVQLAPGERIYAQTGPKRSSNEDNRRLTGPGTIQRYEPPRDNQDSDLLANPVQVIPAEKVSLEYCDSAVRKLNDEIFGNCVGRGGDVLNNQAANELQVQSTFESRINVLSGVRGRVEECRKYIYEVMAQLRYGPLFVGTDLSLGDVYYLSTVKDQQEELKTSREIGIPNYEIQNQINAIYRNKYRDQPEILNRNEILSQLEPYPGLAIKEVAELVAKGLASKEKFLMKIEFESLIKRFEREQMNVVDFASARPLQTKLDIILKKLKEYVQAENDSGEQEQQPGPPNPGAPSPRPLPGAPGEG